jgi:hypothetical protein
MPNAFVRFAAPCTVLYAVERFDLEVLDGVAGFVDLAGAVPGLAHQSAPGSSPAPRARYAMKQVRRWVKH